MQAAIIKLGYELADFGEDSTTFGGMTEIHGLYDDLMQLGWRVKLNTYDSNCGILFIFPSGNISSNLLGFVKNFPNTKILCLTDFNLYLSVQQIGYTHILNQIPGAPNYFPFEKYVVKYEKKGCAYDGYDLWLKRRYNMVYGGGSRKSERDVLYKRYLRPGVVDVVYTSSEGVPECIRREKVPFFILMNEYRQSRYGLYITDPIYASTGWVTQRYYEYLLAGMLPVFDRSCSHLQRSGAELIATDLWLRDLYVSRATYDQLRKSYEAVLQDTRQFMEDSPCMLRSILCKFGFAEMEK